MKNSKWVTALRYAMAFASAKIQTEGTDIPDFEALCKDFETEVSGIEGVETVGTMLSGGVSSMIGMSMGGSADVTSATAYVLLDSEGEKKAAEITAKINDIAEDYSDTAEISVSGSFSSI